MKPTLSLFSYQFPTFFIVIAFSAFIAIGLYEYRIKNLKNKIFAYDLLILIMALSFLGSRLMHVIYEEPLYYLENPFQILAFWNGGFVYFGGLLLAVPGSLYFIHRRKENFWTWADTLAPCASISYAIGRVGCLLQGCCFGQYCDLPWAINNQHPTQLYMIFSELLIFILILIWEKHLKMKSSSATGTVFLLWLILNSFSRIVIGFYRGDDRGYLIAGVISLSQVLAVIFTLITGYLLYQKLKE